MTSPFPWGALCLQVAPVDAIPHSDPEHWRAMTPRVRVARISLFFSPINTLAASDVRLILQLLVLWAALILVSQYLATKIVSGQCNDSS